MIKDPFQTTKTPYEILGIPQNADSATITSAFKTALVKPGKAQESQDAHVKLKNPLSRTVTDLFLYHESYLKQLIPNIVGDELALIQNRDKIAQSWGNIQKQTFPNFAATHSLAILWYMWALKSEESHYNSKEDLSSAPSLTQLWSNAIVHWVLLMNSHAFLNDYSKINNASNLNDNDIKELSSKLEELFKNKLSSYKEKYNQKDDKKSVERFEEYEHLFHSEMNAAKILALLSDKGIQFTNNVSNASICCGPIMLERVGILDHIRTQLDIYRRRDPLNEDLNKLSKILSPNARDPLDRRLPEVPPTSVNKPYSWEQKQQYTTPLPKIGIIALIIAFIIVIIFYSAIYYAVSYVTSPVGGVLGVISVIILMSRFKKR